MDTAEQDGEAEKQEGHERHHGNCLLHSGFGDCKVGAWMFGV